MGEATERPRSHWIVRQLWRQWKAWQRLGKQIFWPLALAVVTLVSHLYLSNRAIVLWSRIQTLREENWQLWWDIQTLSAEVAAQERQALAAYLAKTSWVWPQPDEVVYVTEPEPLSVTWDRTGWTLPPVHDGGMMLLLSDAYTRSLWDVLQDWWSRNGRIGWEVRP